MKTRLLKTVVTILCLLMLLSIAPVSRFFGITIDASAENTYKTSAKVYSDAQIVEHTTQYRYRIKAHQISSATSITGWTRVSNADPLYGDWSAEKSSTSQVTESDTLHITRTETATRYRYYHYVGYKNGTTYWHFCPLQGPIYNSGVSYSKAYSDWRSSRLSGSTLNQSHVSGTGGASTSNPCSACGLRAGQKPNVYYIGQTPYYAEESQNYTAKWYYKTRTKTLRYNYIQYTDYCPWNYTEVTSLDELSFERQDGVDYTLETESRPVAIDEYGVIFSEDMTKIYSVPGELMIECFNIPSTVTEISEGAFQNCIGIKEVVFPASVRIIGNNAFNGCTALETITIPEKITSIGGGAFANCSSIGSVYFKSESPFTLGSNCFSGTAIDCFYVYFLEFKDDWLPYESSWNGYPLRGFNPPGELYSNIDANGTDSRGFTYSLNADSHSATIVGYSGSANVVFPKRVIKDSVEYAVNAFTTNAFKGKTNITKVSMTKLITAIPANAFDGCTALTEIVYNGKFNSIGEYAFRNCSNLSKFDYLNGLTTISTGTFYNCSKLTSISIPSGVKTIGDSAFYGCAKIDNLVIPSSVTNVGASSFYGCKALTIVTFEGAPNIGVSAFGNCTSLATAKFKKDPPASLGNGAFGGTSQFFVQYPGNNSTWKSQVSNYQWRGYAAYSSDIINKIGGGGKTRPYIIKVVNYKGVVLQGAKVTVNGNTQTVPSDGLVYFAMPSGTTASVSINPNNSNYASYNDGNHSINKRTAVEHITVYANHSISGKSFYGQNISNSTHTLNRRYHDWSTLVVSAKSPLKINKIEILSGNTIIASKNNPSSGDHSFSIHNSKFIAEKDVTARMLTEDGRTTTKKLNIVVFDGSMFDYSLSIKSIKDEDAVNLKNSVYDVLKKMKFKTSVPKLLNGVSFSVVNKHSSVSISFSKKSDGTKINEHFSTKSSISVSFELEYSSSSKKLFLAKSSLGVSEKLYGRWNHPVPLGGIPFNLEINAEVGGSGNVSFKWENRIVLDSLSFSFEGKVTASFGIGYAYISAGVYGRLGLKWNWVGKYNPYSSQSYLYGTGELGLYAKILTKRYEVKLLGFTNRQLYPSTRSSAKMVSSYDGYSDELFDPDRYEDIDRHYLSTRSDWLSGSNTRKLTKANVPEIENTADLVTLQTSVYDYLEPRIITCNGTTMMVYADDIANRSQNNLQALVYSIYNPTTGEWSAPQKIDNNDTFDNSFDLYCDGSRIYIVYTEANKTFDDGAELTEISAATDVSFASYDTTTGRFDRIESVNCDEYYDMTATFAMLDGVPTAVWVRNTENNVFGADSSNEIVYSQYIDGSWTTPSILVSRMPQISSIAVGKLNGKAYVAATSDVDNDLDTTDDEKLILASFDGIIKEIETGINNNTNAQFVSFKGSDTLIWSNNGQIQSLTDALAEPTVLIAAEEFEIDPGFGWVDCSNGKYAVTFVSANEYEGSNVFTVYYNGTEWTDPIKVTNTDKYVGAYDAVYVNNKFIVPYRDTDVVFSETDDTFSTTANLCVAYISPVSDAYVVDALVARESLSCGEEAHMLLSIFNNGFNDIENARITMKNAAGNTVFTTTETVQLKSGESKDVEVTFTAPAAVEEGLYQIIVEDTNGTNKENPTVYEIDLWQSDLCVEAEQLILGEENNLLVNVTNDGFVSSSVGQLKVATGTYSEEAEAFATIDVESIEPGATETYIVELNDDIYTDDENSGIVTAWVSTETADAVESNNYSTVAIMRLEKEEEYDEEEVVRFAPDLSVDEVVIDLASPQDAQIAIERNGNVFSRVKDLTEGSQYIYNDGILTLKQSYLSGLEPGAHEIDLLFNEGLENELTIPIIITVTDSSVKPITGAVSIEGEPVFGNTLMINTDAIEPDTADYEIEWKREGSVVGSDSSYEIQADDIGKSITVSIIGTDGYSGTVSSSPVIPSKAEGSTLLSPVLSEANYTSISLVQYEGYEYKCNDGGWTTVNVFENLAPNTEYSFRVRKAETATHTTGAASEIAKFSTKPIPLGSSIVIDGTPERGKVLTAVVVSPGSETYTYQWCRNGTAIQGATSTTYTTTVADVNCDITVKATASGSSVGEITSPPVKVICVHDYTWTTTKQPSCKETGQKTGTCICGNTTNETISALGHTNPDSNGKCTRCGEQIVPVTPQRDPNTCRWCGKVHKGFFQMIIGFFHRILAAIFGAKY